MTCSTAILQTLWVYLIWKVNDTQGLVLCASSWVCPRIMLGLDSLCKQWVTNGSLGLVSSFTWLFLTFLCRVKSLANMTTELFDVGVEVLKQDIYLKTCCVTLKYNVVLQFVVFLHYEHSSNVWFFSQLRFKLFCTDCKPVIFKKIISIPILFHFIITDITQH